MPSKEESRVYQFLRRIVDQWDQIPIRILQDGKWQSLFLSEIKEDRKIADWIYDKLK